MKRFLVLFIILPAPLWAGLQQYQAPLDTVAWTASSKKLHCTLSHDIPLYGRATFAQAAGESLGFSLSTKQKATREQDRAHLRSLPPPWKHQVEAVDLEEIVVHKGGEPFRLDEPLSRRLLAELQKGMFPTFSYRDWADARDQVTVALPGVHIKEALDEFITCLARLPVYKFGDFRDSLFHFDFGKHELDEPARKRLDDVAKYVKTDPEVKRIAVEGHTDNVGRDPANDKLGEQRSRAVKEYLVTQGVSPKLFELKSLGETKPVDNNRTDEGRARNRRASVTLIK